METTAILPELNIFNSQIKKSKQVENYHNFILSLLSALIIGCGGFLWNINAKLARIEERDYDKTNTINDLQLKINSLQLSLFDIRERTIRIEAKQDINLK